MAIQIQDFAKDFVKDFTGEVDAALIVAVDGGRSAVSLSGIDDLGIAPKTVQLVDAMCTVLEEKLAITKMLRDKMREDGVLRSTSETRREAIIDDDDEEDDGDEENKESSDVEAEELLGALFKGIGEIIGREARKHADDH